MNQAVSCSLALGEDLDLDALSAGGGGLDDPAQRLDGAAAPADELADVVPGAAHDLLSVELPGGASALVPAVAALVTVELDAGRVLVEAVPGLLGPPEE